MKKMIHVENISKSYFLGGGTVRRGTTFLALNDISLDIGSGEVVGVIGRNGAGKSTLLKIMSRITAPSAGKIDIYGRIASLLEVGTGFHPELTGRENIYMNGAILGMSRKTIKECFDEIVTFSEISKFIDTQVKYYSSGMYVRLAFAVAAHLDPEILVLDEVLSVGDIGFQRKCLGKMENVAGNGRTVVFVSHNLSAVRQLCPRSVLIDAGKILFDGQTSEAIRRFHELLHDHDLRDEASIKERLAGHTGAVRFVRLFITDASDREAKQFKTGETIRAHIEYEAHENVQDLILQFALRSEMTDEVLVCNHYQLLSKPLNRGDKGRVVIEFPNLHLLPNSYLPYLWFGSVSGTPYDRIDYSQSGCPPLVVMPENYDPQPATGYFRMTNHLIRNEVVRS